VGIIELGFADLTDHPVDQGNLLLVFLVSLADGLIHGVVVHLVGAGFDHDDLFAGGDHGHVQIGGLALLGRGVEDQLAVHKAHLQRGHRAVPGDVGDG